jgi:anti-sigma regulatory factor (Ser/Thr protein kinase)/anti-anti-sigma regulatory factor
VSSDTGKSCLVSVPAHLDDDNLEGFFEELHSAIMERPAEIVLDCVLLEHATSRHINALWDALTHCERAGVRMRMISVGCGLERVLKILGLAGLFSIEREGPGKGRGPRQALPGPVPRRFEIEMDAGAEAVRDAMEGLSSFLERLDLPEIGVYDIETAFYEVATNICLHGGLRKGCRIKLVAELRGDEVSLEFIDDGERFDPTGNMPEFDPRLAVKRGQRRGLGLVMIRRLMDAMSYERIDGKLNVVTLRKRFTPCGEVRP